jgi:hypothetical protein
MSERWRVNAPTVVSEVIDGEAIVMRLDTGTYYSLAGSGAEVWGLVGRSMDVPAVVDWMCAAFEGPREEIAAAVRGLVTDLAGEGLLVPAGESAPSGAPAPPEGPRRPFTPPVVNRYTDMQELLLVDPIHEVDEAGWPHGAGTATPSSPPDAAGAPGAGE